MIIAGDQQLTGQLRISDSGSIAVPFFGSVKATCLTSQQLTSRISKELQQRNLFQDPSVVVEVTDYRHIFVLGKLNKVGQFPYQSGMTVLTAVAVVGGFTYCAMHDCLAVLRNIDGSPVEGLAKGAILL
jgi:polysaccharide biosynthesis/export protein